MNVAKVRSCRGCHLLVLSNVAAAPLQRRPRPTIHRYTALPQNLQPWNSWHQALPGTSVLVKPAASAAVIAASRRRWSSPCTALESSSRYSEVATLKIYESHESPIAEKSPDLGFQPQPLLLWSWPWFLRPEESRKCLRNAEKRKSTCASLVK